MTPITPDGARGGFALALAAACLLVGAAALRSGPAAAGTDQDAPWTALFPARVELRRCDMFDTTIVVNNAVDLAGFQVSIGFDPAVLNFEAAEVAPWLAGQWTAYSTLPPFVEDGVVRYAAVADPESTTATGSGEMASLRFRALAAGQSPLDLHNVVLVNSRQEATPVTSTDAIVIVQNEDGPGCAPTPSATPGTAGIPTHTPTTGATPTASATARTPTPSTQPPTPTGVASATPSVGPSPTGAVPPPSPTATLTVEPTPNVGSELYLPASSTRR